MKKWFGNYKNTSLWFQEYWLSVKEVSKFDLTNLFKFDNHFKLIKLGVKFPKVIIQDFSSFTVKQKIITLSSIILIVGVFGLNGGGGSSFNNEYCLTLNDYMGMGGRVDIIVKLQKLEKNPDYKGYYEYYQIHNGGSDFDLYHKGKYTYSKGKGNNGSLVLVPTHKNGVKMDYDWSDGLRDNIMTLIIDDNNFTSLTFDYGGFPDETMNKCD